MVLNTKSLFYTRKLKNSDENKCEKNFAFIIFGKKNIWKKIYYIQAKIPNQLTKIFQLL